MARDQGNPTPERTDMLLRTVPAYVLALSLFALPLAADAGGAKAMWLTMNANGTLVSASPRTVEAVPPFSRPAGTYEITFYRDLTGCAVTGTTSGGWAATVGVAVDGFELTVFVMNPLTGDLMDLPFSIMVMCGK
jgi:hypothetical protein